MSADPPRKAYKYTCSMIRPQIYSEKSLMESVVDFFSDVVPQAYTGTQKPEDREKIQWVRFENCDCNDVAKNPDMFRSDTKGLPLLLILGYSNGVQIWNITTNGEAQEVLSMRQGPVRICRILPNPDPVLGNSDSYSYKRPLIIMCDSSSAGQPYCGVKFVSLKTGDEVHSISYKTLPVQNIECNKRFLAIVFMEKVCLYESSQFQQLFWITSCYPCPGPTVNPIALSTRWLAYADKRLVAMHQSCGGMSGDGSQSYAATVISAAKGAFKGLSMFGEAMVSSVTGCKPTAVKRDCVQLDNGNRPGIVTVVDIQNIHNDHFNVNEDNEGDGLIAHFHAHANEPVSNMAFDSTGTLLVTACKLGHNFHVFRLMAHPVSSSLGAVHHLYTLHRGETTAKVIDISFNHDSRWITVSSHRGTTHLFPITPYGGPVNIRTHCKPHVVNRASRFHRSAGLDEFDHSVGRRSPVLSTSPSSSGQYDRYPTLIQQNTLNNNMGNPRLPPYPHPITLYPTFQVKQPLNVALNPGNKNQSPSHSPTGFDNVYCVCAKFCTPRLCVIGSPKLDVERRDGGKRPVDSLFVMAQSGILVEYVLEPRAKSVSDKVTDDCLLELNVVGRMQWNLQRLKNSPELRPPLPSNSPLILAHEAVVSQIPTAPDLYDLPGLTRQDSKDSLSSDHSSKDDSDEQWLSQVEIITHAGPHRRLWMGPQFSFKTYQENTTVLSSNSSSLLSQSPESNMAAMDMMGDEGDLESLKLQPARSNPVSMPNARPAYRRLSGSDSPSTVQGIGAQSVPLLIEAGSFDQSPHLLDVYSNWTESTVAKQPRGSDDLEEDRLKETLADAMVESPCKDLDKLSLRHQDIPRASVRAEKGRVQGTQKSAEGTSEGVAAKHKKKEDLRKTDIEPVKSNVDEKKVKHSETTTPKDKKGKGTSRKPNKVEERVKPESVEVSKSEEVKKAAKKVEFATDTGKNGKKKGSPRKSLDSEFESSNSTAKKSVIESNSNDTKVDKQIDKIVQDEKPDQSKREISTAKDNTANVKKDEIPNRSSVCVSNPNEKDKTNELKSTAKINANTSSDDCVQVAESNFIDRNSEKEENLEHVKIKQNSDVSSPVLCKSQESVSQEKSNVETGVTKENLVSKEKIDEDKVKASSSESQSKGKSKRKNKKQNKNVMTESMSEKSPVRETSEIEICKQLSAASLSEKSELSLKRNTSEIKSESNQESTVLKKDSEVNAIAETADFQEPSNAPDTESKTENKTMKEEIEERKVHVETSSGALDQEANNSKKIMDENLPLDYTKASGNSGMDIDDPDTEETVSKSRENSREKSSVDTKTKKKKKTGTSSDSDLTETKNKTNKMEKSITKDEQKRKKNEFQTVDEYDKSISASKYDKNISKQVDKCKEDDKKQISKQEKDTDIAKPTEAITENNGNKIEKQPEMKSLTKIEESRKPDMYDYDKLFEVKSKKKRKKKKNGMEDSLYFDTPIETEKPFVLDIQGKDQGQAKKEEASVEDTDFVCKVTNDCAKTTKTQKVLPEVEKVSETELIAAKDQKSSKSPSKEVLIVEEKLEIIEPDFEKSGKTLVNTENKTKENVKEVLEVKLAKYQEHFKDETTEEEMFVVPKRKNRKKKKSEELHPESSRSSSETEIILEQNKDDKKERAIMLDEDRSKDKLEVESRHDDACKIIDERCMEKKSSPEKENLEGELVKELKDEEDEVIVVMEEKRMEDSAESGSKYETAESAEDDPSAWERFEECTAENESECDTAVESHSNISCEKSIERQFELDASGSPRKQKSIESDPSTYEMPIYDVEKGKEKPEVTDDVRNKKKSGEASIDEIELLPGNKLDMGASVMVMSVYEESASSSNRSSEERDGIGRAKNASEKETKSKKKKRKNKK